MDRNNERLLTSAEVAALFRVDAKTVTRWAASGRITSIRTPGGHRRFRESEVRALLRSESKDEDLLAVSSETATGSTQPASIAHLHGVGSGDFATDAPTRESGQISVYVYLDTDDELVISKAIRHLDEFVETLGYDGPIDPVVERGSFIRISFAKLRRTLTSSDARDLSFKAQRALELVALESRQAEVNNKNASSVANVIHSLENIPSACIRVGSLLLVKYSGPERPVIMTKTLSDREIRTFERYPGIQKDPKTVIEHLALDQVDPAESKPAF